LAEKIPIFDLKASYSQWFVFPALLGSPFLDRMRGYELDRFVCLNQGFINLNIVARPYSISKALWYHDWVRQTSSYVAE
jgi:hypothetical protein